MKIHQKVHYPWVDIVRIVAIFLMVLAHACDGYISQFDTNQTAFLSGVIAGSLARSCVPLFVMISGVLLFPARMQMHSFYFKRIGRILKPLIFWSIVTPLMFYLYFNYVNPLTSNPSIDLNNHTFLASLNKIALFFINFNYDTTPLWYLYMLIGLYLIIPVINPWLEKATQREFKTILLIWIVTLFLPYVEIVAPFIGYKGNYGSMGILGESFWNKYGTFYYFSGFIGYLLLGHYLVKYPLQWGWKKLLLICVPLFLTGYFITAGGFLMMQQYFPGNYQYLEMVWYFTGINVAMMTVPVFLVIQKIPFQYSVRLANFASLMFGVYLVHYVVVQVVYDLVQNKAHPLIQIMAITTLAFFVSLLITWIMKKGKYTKQFVL